MKVIVSLTSWKCRIHNVSKVVFSLYENTRRPDLIIVNLSSDEFENKEKDLPPELNTLIKNGICEIYWVKENTNVFKKIIPTVKRFYGAPNYILFSCDDDWLYGKTYIEQMIKQLGNGNSFCASKHKLIGNRVCYNSKCFDEILWLGLNDDIIKYRNDDAYLDVYFKLKHIELSNAPIESIIKEIIPFNQTNPNGKIDGGYTTSRKCAAYTAAQNSLRNYFKMSTD